MTLQKEKGDGLSDNRVVRVISTASDATLVISVQRTVKTGEKISVPCPLSIEDYNRFMGGVDRGDQLRGYYRCPTKVHKFYNYVHLLLPKGYLHYEQLHIISTVFTHQRTENPPLISSRVGQEANWRLLLQKEQDTLEIARNSSLPSSPPWMYAEVVAICVIRKTKGRTQHGFAYSARSGFATLATPVLCYGITTCN